MPSSAWVGLDPSVRYQETEQLARRYPESTLLRVEHEVYLTKAVEGLAQVLDERVLVLRLDDDVVHVGLDVAAHLGAETLTHHPLEGCPGILEPERHANVAVATFRRDERRLLLVLHGHLDLVVP